MNGFRGGIKQLPAQCNVFFLPCVPKGKLFLVKTLRTDYLINIFHPR